MNRIELETVEDSSELDPRAPGVWAQGSFNLDDDETLLADAEVVQIHVRGERRAHHLPHLRRGLRPRATRQLRIRQTAESVC